MQNSKFSIKEAFVFGINTLKNNFLFFIVLFVISFIILFSPNILLKVWVSSFPKTKILIAIISFYLIYTFLSTTILLGLTKICLNFYDNIKSKISDVFSQYKLIFRYIFASILSGLAVLISFLIGTFSIFFLIGLSAITSFNLITTRFHFLSTYGAVMTGLFVIVSVIVSIYIGIRLQFYEFFIVDKNEGVISSLKKSWQITKGNVLKLSFFLLLSAGLNILGSIFFLVGLFVSIPVTMLAYAFVYRKLLNEASIEKPDTKTPEIPETTQILT